MGRSCERTMKIATAARRAQKESMRARADERAERRTRPRTRQASEREGRSLTPGDVAAASTRGQGDGGRQSHDDERQARGLVRVLAEDINENGDGDNATSRAERADNDADERADEEGVKDHQIPCPGAGVGGRTPREAASAGSMMSQACLPAAMSMPMARRAGVACS